MVLSALHPGASIDLVKQNTGWDLKVSNDLRETLPPSENELRILRENLDPTGIYI